VVDADSLSEQATAKNCITVGASENNRPHGSVPAPGGDFTYGAGWPATFPADPIKSDHISNNPNGMAAFSSRGPTDDGRIKPDVVAPGTNILSVRSSATSSQGWGLLPTNDARRQYYMYMGGTSMATPITAGTVALIRQYLQGACRHNPSSALVKALLIHGAQPMAGQYPVPEVGAVPNRDEGWGRISLEQTLFPTYPTKLEFRDSASDAVGAPEVKSYTFKVVNTSVAFRATLAWTDYPSAPTAAGLVNQLRLSVVAPDGTITQGSPQNNNVQQVVLSAPKAGTYTVRVTGVNVPTVTMTGVNKKQDFALAVTGGLDFVDVYIKDNPMDNGIPPSVGSLCQSPDVWVSLSNDPSARPAGNPEYGQTNYVFVRVHNRGSRAATNAQVKLYWAHAGTNLSRAYWKTDGIKVNGVAGNTRAINVPARGTGGDGEAITAAFEWLPPDPTQHKVEPGHFCLFATVSHPDDPILMEDVDLVRWEDNLAWKNQIVTDSMSDGTTSAEFYVAGIQGASLGALYIDSTSAPKGGEIKLKMPTRYLDGSMVVGLRKVWESEGGVECQVALPTGASASLTGIKLKSKENTLVRLEVTLPSGVRSGDVYPVSVEQRVNGRSTGSVTLVARVVGTPAFIANRNPHSLEVHLPNCSWVDKISGSHKVPFDDLQLALRRGYNGCRFCLPQYDNG
jgi:subtilisin family serine protease